MIPDFVKKKYVLIVYGGLMAVLLIILDTVNYKVILRQLDVRIYGALIASIFLLIGLYFGYTGYRRHGRSQGRFKHDHYRLSPRELDVLKLMAEGLTNQEIADRLYVSLNTVKTHTSNIYSKLDVQRRTQAIEKARKSMLL